MHFSGPLPAVSSFSLSTTLSSSKLMVIAPPASAIESRSGRQSIATTCFAPRRTALRIAEQAGGGVAEDLVRDRLVASAPLANGKVAALALVAFAADDRERNDDPVTFPEVAVHAGADLDDLAHHLVSHDVAGQHRRD